MGLSVRQIRSMHLAGTVSVPQTFPELGRLSIVSQSPPGANGNGNGNACRDLLVVEHEISPKLTVTRTFFVNDVAAIFLPADPDRVQLTEGVWLVSDEILSDWRQSMADCPSGPLGIAYVREQAATLMRVEVGMTAAESAEYYPPLPHDRSIDHYQLSADRPETPHVCDTGDHLHGWKPAFDDTAGPPPDFPLPTCT